MNSEHRHALIAISIPFLNLVPLLSILTFSFEMPLQLYYSVPLLFLFLAIEAFSTIYRRKGPPPTLFGRIREAFFLTLMFTLINLIISGQIFKPSEITIIGHFIIIMIYLSGWIIAYQIQKALANQEEHTEDKQAEISNIHNGIKRCRGIVWSFIFFNIVILLVGYYYNAAKILFLMFYFIQISGNFLFILILQRFRLNLSFRIQNLQPNSGIPLLTIVLIIILFLFSLLLTFKAPVIQLGGLKDFILNTIRYLADRFIKPDEIVETTSDPYIIEEPLGPLKPLPGLPEETFFSVFLKHLAKGVVGLALIGLLIVLMYPLIQRLRKSKYARKRERKLFFQQIKDFFTKLFSLKTARDLRISKELPSKKELQKFFSALIKEKKKTQESMSRFIAAFYSVIKWGSTKGIHYSTNLSPLEYCRKLSETVPQKSQEILQFGGLLEQCFYSQKVLRRNEEKILLKLAETLPKEEV